MEKKGTKRKRKTKNERFFFPPFLMLFCIFLFVCFFFASQSARYPTSFFVEENKEGASSLKTSLLLPSAFPSSSSLSLNDEKYEESIEKVLKKKKSNQFNSIQFKSNQTKPNQTKLNQIESNQITTKRKIKVEI